MLILVLALLMSGIIPPLQLSAQQRNILSIPDAIVQIGQAQLPIVIENTDELLAAQFDITLPEEVTTTTTAAAGSTGGATITPTARAAGHKVIVRRISGTRYRVMIFSDENQPILGNTGGILTPPITIPASFEAGSEHALTLTDVSLASATTSENALTDVQAGKIIVGELPDLAPSELTVVGGDLQSPTTLTPGEPFVASWKVSNVGGKTATGGWSEQLVLLNSRGTVQKLLTTVYYTQELASGAEVTRQAEVTMPQLVGIDGTAYLQVIVVPDSKMGESTTAQGNNTFTSDTELTVQRRLFKQCPGGTA